MVGTACAVMWRSGRTLLLVPADERDAAARSWAEEVRVMAAGREVSALEALLADAAHEFGDGERRTRIGVERGPSFEPAPYVAMCVYGASMLDVVANAWPEAALVPADEMFADLRAITTQGDRARIADACDVAERAFATAAHVVRPGLNEREAAALVRAPLSVAAPAAADRANGFVFCMSGANSANAYRAYARSTARRLERGELVLIHCNSYVDGYWTDVTRTYCLGPADQRQRAMYDAVFAARAAALDAIRPGVPARDVDRAARAVIDAHGFGGAFKHSTGHGVGFGAIDHNAAPRLAPESDDVLALGMVCNVEPAIYLDGYGGLRHCDVVAVTDTGARILTPFQAGVNDLILP